MNLFIYMTFISLFSLDYLANNLHLIPQKLFLVPEAMGGLAMVLVVLLGISRKQFDMSPKYVIFWAWFILTILAGIILNNVDPLVSIAGLRIYLKSLGFFLLPLVYTFSDKQIKWQLGLLALLCVTQLPLAAFQRFIQYAGVNTGDVVGGSLGTNTSGMLSVLLICAIAVVTALLVKKRIKPFIGIMLIAIFFLPTTLNETKVTMLLFPMVIIAPVFFAPNIKNRGRKLVMLSTIGFVAMVGFFVVYDILQAGRGDGTLMERMQEGRMFSYMYKADDVGKFSDLEVGRFDAISYAAKKISDTGNEIFGVGIGNASPSNNAALEGEFHKKWYWMNPAKVMASRIIWEMGILGLALYIILMTLIFRDASKLAKHDDFMAAFALGWMPIILIIVFSFIYLSAFVAPIFSHIFLLYSGHIAGESYRRKQGIETKTELAQRNDPKRFAALINPRTKKIKSSAAI